MEISTGIVTAGCAVVGLVGGVLIRWVDSSITNVKATQKLQFEKLDLQNKDLQDYKLHAAETYVNQAALEKQLAPINASLKEIRDELRDDRNER